MENKIVVLAAESSSGKDSLAKEVEKLGYKFIINTTTRPMREGESQGNPHNFVSVERFNDMAEDDKFVEFKKFKFVENGKETIHYYGAEKDQILDDEKYVIVLDFDRMVNFSDYFRDRVEMIYVYVDENTRHLRAKDRGGFEQAEWDRRAEDERIVYSKSNVFGDFDHFIKNYNFKKALSEIKNILQED